MGISYILPIPGSQPVFGFELVQNNDLLSMTVAELKQTGKLMATILGYAVKGSCFSQTICPHGP